MVFQKKKVRMETLSEYLREIRLQLHLSVKEVSLKTGIAKKFIEGLESGNFDQLPPDVYVLGFLQQLAEVYAVPAAVLTAQFKKERGIAEKVSAPSHPGPTRSSRILKNIVITPKLLSLAVGALVLLIIIGYIIWELIGITAAPALAINEPRDGQVVTSSSLVVSGKTDPGLTLTINGKTVPVAPDGVFRTTVAITAGSQELEISAQSKFSKTTVKRIKITGEFSNDATNASASAPITLHLDFVSQTTLSLVVDGNPTPTETETTGGSKIITAQREIILSVADGGAVKATLNDKILGILGKKGEPLNNVSFTSDAARSVAVPKTSK